MTNLKANFHNLYFIVLIYYVISLPLPAAYNSVGLILLFALFLFSSKNLKTNFLRWYSDKKNVFLLVIFIAITISLLYSQDKNAGLKGVLSALPLITIPLSLSAFTKIREKQILSLKKIFVWACFITSFVYLFFAIKRSGLFDGSYKLVHAPENFYPYFVSQLTYNHLSPSIHAIFYSLYIALAVFLIVFDLKKSTLRSKMLSAILLLYFLVFLFMLISITINFALYSFLALFSYSNFSFKKIWHYLVFIGTILAGASTTAYLIAMKYIGPYGDGIYRFDSADMNKKIILAVVSALAIGVIAILLKIRFSRNYPYLIGTTLFIVFTGVLIYFMANKIGDLRENNISVRFKYANAAINVIKKRPLTGIGIGDKKNQWIMNSEDLPPGAKPGHVFNSHNQFLDLWVAAGIAPTICFILFLFVELKRALNSRMISFIGVVYCFSLFCFTDSAMMTQRGQAFILFFIWLFELELKKGKEPILSIQ